MDFYKRKTKNLTIKASKTQNFGEAHNRPKKHMRSVWVHITRHHRFDLEYKAVHTFPGNIEAELLPNRTALILILSEFHCLLCFDAQI